MRAAYDMQGAIRSWLLKSSGIFYSQCAESFVYFSTDGVVTLLLLPGPSYLRIHKDAVVDLPVCISVYLYFKYLGPICSRRECANERAHLRKANIRCTDCPHLEWKGSRSRKASASIRGCHLRNSVSEISTSDKQDDGEQHRDNSSSFLHAGRHADHVEVALI